MGTNSHSPQSLNNFNPNQWQQIDSAIDHQILQSRSLPTQLIEQHSIIISDHEQLLKTQQLFHLRNHHPELVSTNYINIQKYQELCSQLYCGSIYTERIPLRLSNIVFIPFPDILHLYNQCIYGFHLLSKQLGFFKINQDCIGINQNNVVKVWLSSNFSQTNPHSPIQSEQEMVKNIIQLIESNTNPITMPLQQPSLIGYFYKSKKKLKFEQLKIKLQQYINQFNKGILPNYLSCIQKMDMIHLKEQQKKKLIHYSSTHSLTTIDQATQTKGDIQINKVSVSIGDSIANSRFYQNTQLNQSKTFYHSKSKTKLSINYISKQPPPIPIKITSQQKTFISPPKHNQSLNSNIFSRSQSQSKLHYPNSKLETQPTLIRSGTLKTLKTHSNASLMTIHQQSIKPTQNHTRNTHHISLPKVDQLLSSHQSILPQSSSRNHKSNQLHHQFSTSPIENRTRASNSIQSKIRQPIALKTIALPQTTSLHIPPLHFLSSNIKNTINPSSFRFSFSSHNLSREKQHMSIGSSTNCSNQKNTHQETKTIKSHQQFTQYPQPLESSSKHHDNISIPVFQPLQNPEILHLHEEIPLNTLEINTQNPIQNNAILKQSQPIQTKVNQNIKQITPQQQIASPIQINTEQKLIITPQPQNKIHIKQQQLLPQLNYSPQKNQNQLFYMSPIQQNGIDNQLKIQSKYNNEPEFPINQSISSIAYRQDQDYSISYLDWQNKDQHPKSTRSINCFKIDEIANENKYKASYHNNKQYNDNKPIQNLLGISYCNKPVDHSGKFTNQGLYGQNASVLNHLQNISHPDTKFSHNNPIQSSCTYLYNLANKHQNGTAMPFTQTYSSIQKQLQKQSNNIQYPFTYKTITNLPKTKQTIMDFIPVYKQHSNSFYKLDNMKFRYYLDENEPYNIEWDPQILADLKANMLKN